MKKTALLLVLMSIVCMMSAQRTTTSHEAFAEGERTSTLQHAFMEEDGSMNVKEITVPFNEKYDAKEGFEQVEGWPKVFINPSRWNHAGGVTLADLNNDGIDEIIFPFRDTLYVFKGNGDLLWSLGFRYHPGMANTHSNAPPSVADVTGDGNLEVVIRSCNFSTIGYVFVVDNTGKVLPGWPFETGSFRDEMNTPILADLDNNGQMEIIFGTNQSNYIHILKADGTPLNDNWPVSLIGDHSSTLSAGDINNDGQLDIIATDRLGNLYAFNLLGQSLPGFPVENPGTQFIDNCPMLADFDHSGELSIVASASTTPGNRAEHFVRNHNGEYRSGWPVPDPTYGSYDALRGPSTVADINADGNLEILHSRTFGWNVAFNPEIPDPEFPVVFGFSANGEALPYFPLTSGEFYAGNTGYISVADMDGDGQFELFFGASHTAVDGNGFIHCYKHDGSGELPGFPLRPQGFSWYNGAQLGDVTGDGMLNLVAVTIEFIQPRSVFFNVYNLGVPMEDANIQFGTYKGSNTRTGLYEASPFKDDAPAAVTNFMVTPAAQGGLQATLTWNNPALQVNGSPLTELNQVKIFRNSVEIATIDNPVIGAEQTFIDNTIQERGSYTYRILGINDAGRGVNTFAYQIFIGPDVPAAPGNFVITTDFTNATISWEAPAEGLNGGYFTGENVTYTVLRMPGEHVVAENISGLQVEDNEVALGWYSYRVTASNHIGEGGSTSSDRVLLAPEGVLMYEPFDYPVSIPWSPAIPEGWEIIGAHMWALVDGNNAGGANAPEMWLIGEWTYEFDDSWLKSPPVDLAGNRKLKLTLNQALYNYSWADYGEVLGIDVTYDDGSTWDVIWERAIGTAYMLPGEYEYYFYVPEGATSLNLGFRLQGSDEVFEAYIIDDLLITDASDLYEVNFNIADDSDEALPIAEAKVVIDGNEYFSGANGQVTVHLPTGTNTTAVVSAYGYISQEVLIIVDQEDQTVEVKLMDEIIAPYDLHVTTENLEEGQALLSWLGADYVFRHDDGTATAQLGFNGGTLNSLLGSVYRYDAILKEMSWFLTDAGGPHNSVKIWVFDLDNNGMPDPTRILFQQVVSNVDMQWNTFKFPTPIKAQNGFFLGISHEGFLGLAIDTGTDPNWPFQPNTHFYAGDYNGGFSPIESLWLFNNFMIRALGTNYGALRHNMNTAPQPLVHDAGLSSVKLDKPFEAGNPQYTGFNKSFAGYNVYLNDLTTPVAENISALSYLFTGLGTGSHVAGVQSVYTTGVSEIVTEQFEVVNGVVNADANILSFAFNAAENPSLPADVVGVINPATFSVTLEVLENVDISSLIATFTLSNLATASVDGVVQVSGVTANNFNNPVVYTVTAEAGNTQDWTVTVNTIPCLNPWSYLVTGSIHTINIPLAAAPEIFGVPLAPLDWIGVFYLNDDGEETCGGAVQWTGTGNVAIIAYGDDPTTNEKDGFDAGEIFRWRLSQCGNSVEFPAVATYNIDQPNQGSFASFGLSRLTSLKAATIQYYAFNQGWNSISSYLIPIDPAVANMFSPIVNNLTILSNLTSVYWPSQGVNTIGNWNSNSGYVAKVTANVGFMIGGADYVSGTMTIPAGWSYLPVLSECPANVMEMFGSNLADVVIIQELIGTGVFWPAYEINTIGHFQPGKAYVIKLLNPVVVTFPDCDQKSSTQPTSGINRIGTIWGELNYSPEKQVSAILKSALSDLQSGDLVGAFNADDLLCGYIEIGTVDHNLAITLFGNDQTSSTTTGLINGEPVFFKLYRSLSGEVFDLEVEYDISLENSTGNYHTGTFAAITNIILKSTGMNEMNPVKYSIMPNPAKETITITAATGAGHSVEALIYDMHGTLLIENSFQKQTSISIGNLNPGVYMVVLRTAYSHEVQKLIVR